MTDSTRHSWRTYETMATIGTFASTGNGFSGAIKTLNLNVKAKLIRVDNPSDKGPHFRIYSGNVELGAAWQKTAKDTERDYLSVKLDDPSFPAPILRHPDRGRRRGRPPTDLVPAEPGLKLQKVGSAERRGLLPSTGDAIMTVDTIEELRAELRECVSTPAEQGARSRTGRTYPPTRRSALSRGEGISPLVLRLKIHRRYGPLLR